LGGRAVVYDHGAVTDLGTPESGYRGSVALAINNSGQVTGYLATTLPLADYHTFLYSNGVLTDLGTFPNSHYSVGYAIDAQGRITGQYGANNPARSFLYSNEMMIDIGSLGGPVTFAYGINSLGHITGGSLLTSNMNSLHAFLYIDGQMTDIGSFGGRDCSGRGINDLDQIVGPCGLPSSTVYHAFLYANGAMQDLNALIDPGLGVTLENAIAINDRGYIAVNGFTSSGLPQGYLLIPVPELGTLWLMGITFACLTFFIRARTECQTQRQLTRERRQLRRTIFGGPRPWRWLFISLSALTITAPSGQGLARSRSGANP